LRVYSTRYTHLIMPNHQIGHINRKTRRLSRGRRFSKQSERESSGRVRRVFKANTKGRTRDRRPASSKNSIRAREYRPSPRVIHGQNLCVCPTPCLGIYCIKQFNNMPRHTWCGYRRRGWQPRKRRQQKLHPNPKIFVPKIFAAGSDVDQPKPCLPLGVTCGGKTGRPQASSAGKHASKPYWRPKVSQQSVEQAPEAPATHKEEYVARKQGGKRDKRRAQRLNRNRGRSMNLDVLAASGKWNQDRRNFGGCMWQPKKHVDYSPVDWDATSESSLTSEQEREHERVQKQRLDKLIGDAHVSSEVIVEPKIKGERRIPYDLTMDEQKFFKAIFGPEYTFGTMSHDHGLCAAIRYEAQKKSEDYVRERFKPATIYDIWGSARLEAPDKHSIMPENTLHDGIRRRPERSCTCEPRHCHHVVKDSCMMMVDSLYYLRVNDIVALLKNVKYVFSLHHSFDGVFKVDICGTYAWFNDGTNVTCQIGRGNAKHSYKHSNLDWLRSKMWPLPQGGYLHYEMITTHGPMEFGVFAIKQYDLAVKVADTVRKTAYVGREGVWFNKQDKTVFVEQKMFYLAKNFVRGKVLDAATMRDLISRLKRAEIQDNSYMAVAERFPEMWYKHVSDVIGATFCDLETERLNVNRIKNNAHDISDFNVMQSEMFKPRKTLPFFRILLGLGLVAFGVTGQRKGSRFLWAPIVVSGVYCLGTGLIRTHAGFKERMIQSPMAFFGNVFEPDVCVLSDHQTLPNVPMRQPQVVQCGSSMYLKRVCASFQRVKGKLQYTESRIICDWNGDCGCKMKMDRQRGILKLAWIDGFEPFSFSGCEGNIYFALRMRFMRDLPPIETQSWEELERSLIYVTNEFKRRKIYIDHKGWYHGWVNKFPINKQNKMNAAFNDPEPVSKATFAATVCCKYEIGIMKEPLKPRAFFPKAPSNLVRNGPSMYYIKKHLMYLMNGIRTPFIFGPGHNSLQLGQKFQKAMARKNLLADDVVSVEIDLSMCETTMRGPFLVFEGDIYRALGLGLADVDFLLNHRESFGKSTRRNLSFRMPFCRESGTANTTPGNTVVFAGMLWATLYHLGLSEDKFVCLIGGDDACIYLKRENVMYARRAIEFITRMGLKPEPFYHDNMWSGRFFSGRMMQVRRVGGGLTYCHVPLVGRCVAKNICCKYRGQRIEPWLRDVSQGRIFEWEHIPILRQINLAMRAKYSGVIGKCRIEMPSREIDPTRVRLIFSDETFEQMAAVYNLTVDDINKTCEYVGVHFQGDWIGKPLNSEILEIMASIDLK